MSRARGLVCAALAACGGGNGDGAPDGGPPSACAAATITDGVVTGAIPDEAPDYAGSCGGDGTPHRAYRFVAPATGSVAVQVDAVATPWDPILYVREGCDGAELACVTGDGTARAAFCVDEGVEYVAFVEAVAADPSAELAIRVTSEPCLEGATCEIDRCVDAGNDACEAALPLGPGDIRHGSTLGAANDADGNCDVAGPDTVYHYTAASTGVATFTVNPAGWTASVHVRGDCAGDRRTCGGPSGTAATASLCVAEGETYEVFVDGWMTDQAGDYTLHSTFEPCPADATCFECLGHGDRCADPLPLTVGTVAYGDTRGAGDDYDSLCGAAAAEPDLVYQLVAPASGRLDVRVDADPSWTFRPRAYVAAAADCPGAISCAGTAGADFILTSACVEAGQAYAIVVEGSTQLGEDRGPFAISTSITACPGGCAVNACQ